MFFKKEEIDLKKKLSYIIILLFIFTFTSNAINKNKAAMNNVILKEIQIESGDTLWDIAKENISNEEDIRNYIYEIIEINNLKNVNIHAGETIVVPIKKK